MTDSLFCTVRKIRTLMSSFVLFSDRNTSKV